MIADGVLVIDKPPGVTSSRVVQTVRRLLGIEKVGHTGTLDPMATGVLPLCLGQATALAQIFTGQDKRYAATLQLGIATDSGDADGKVTVERPVPPLEREAIERELQTLVGAQRQTPPMVSALQVGGKRLYDLARKGISVERESRAITIHSLALLEWAAPELRFEVCCSKGTYVRVLAEDLAVRLGTIGHLTALRRLSSGRFTLAQATTVSTIEQSPDAVPVIPMTEAIGELARAVLDVSEARALAYGKRPERRFDGPPGLLALLGPDGAVVGLGERDSAGALALKRVFVKP